MIKYVDGLIRDYKDPYYVVNPVSTSGLMSVFSKGNFKKSKFPNMHRDYEDLCKKNLFHIGVVSIHRERDYNIINFPTKKCVFGEALYSHIKLGLDALKKEIKLKGIKEIVIPPIGCGFSGLGGLDKSKVEQMIVDYFGEDLDVEVLLIHFKPKRYFKQQGTM